MRDITIGYLQAYIKAKDYAPEKQKDYFLKLTEEVGELARALRKDLRPGADGGVKNTIEEELWDVMYYALALANCCGIDLEAVIPAKEALNHAKYGNTIVFGEELSGELVPGAEKN